MGGLLLDPGDQFSVKESWLMDHPVAATALKITSNACSSTLRNYALESLMGLEMNRGECVFIHLALHSVSQGTAAGAFCD